MNSRVDSKTNRLFWPSKVICFIWPIICLVLLFGMLWLSYHVLNAPKLRFFFALCIWCALMVPTYQAYLNSRSGTDSILQSLFEFKQQKTSLVACLLFLMGLGISASVGLLCRLFLPISRLNDTVGPLLTNFIFLTAISIPWFVASTVGPGIARRWATRQKGPAEGTRP